MPQLFWFRRDLRLQDNIALNRAIAAASDNRIAICYSYNRTIFEKLSGPRQHSLIESLRSLNSSLENKLMIIQEGELVRIATELKVDRVYATRAFDPEGVAQQNAMGLALKEQNIFLQLEDSNYAVSPGTVTKADGSAYKVYTPFYRNWLEKGWSEPQGLPTSGFEWFMPAKSSGLPVATKPSPFAIRAGETYALETLERFKNRALNKYDELRNRADLSGTSHLSHALAHGEIHPRTILSQLGNSEAEIVFTKEIAWREFYADVLWHNPTSLDDYYEPRFKFMKYDSGASADDRLEAWKSGNTGYPMVDAGMRQLLAEGWMHNRVRMIVASFLVKDLHLEWQIGAKHFEEHLTDYDPASNSHGWQWTAGCGTDASPYYRVFNPILQGYKFDPEGNYVRKYIPELRNIMGAQVHEPWGLLGAESYPDPIVDHATERDEALARLAALKVQ